MGLDPPAIPSRESYNPGGETVLSLYVAHTVCPVATAPIARGAVVVQHGRVIDVGPADAVRARHPAEPIHDLGDRVILPGLINAHTHLELSWMADVELPGGDVGRWVRALLTVRDDADVSRRLGAIDWAIDSLVERGVVAIGDVSNGLDSVGPLVKSPLEAIVFHELLGPDPAAADAAFDAARDRIAQVSQQHDPTSGGVRLSIVPHAAHTTSLSLTRRCAVAAIRAELPLSVHTAEHVHERELLRDGDGPFVELFRDRGGWEPSWRAPVRSSVAALQAAGALGAGTLLVHAIDVDGEDLDAIATSGATVVTCPRSNRFLGCGEAPIDAFVERKIPLAVATDSLASAPDLDPWAELAALLKRHPGLDRDVALASVTLTPARALGLDHRLGSIEIGKAASLIAVTPAAPRADVEFRDPLGFLSAPPTSVERIEATAPVGEST